jgi:hypothetical protein
MDVYSKHSFSVPSINYAILCNIIILLPPLVKFKLNIFIHVDTQNKIKDYTQIIHLYYSDGTFSKGEVEEWLGEIGGTLNEINDKKIVFTYFDAWYPTRMTVYKSGRTKVETDLDELP